MARSVPANAAAFAMYEVCVSALTVNSDTAQLDGATQHCVQHGVDHSVQHNTAEHAVVPVVVTSSSHL